MVGDGDTVVVDGDTVVVEGALHVPHFRLRGLHGPTHVLHHASLLIDGPPQGLIINKNIIFQARKAYVYLHGARLLVAGRLQVLHELIRIKKNKKF